MFLDLLRPANNDFKTSVDRGVFHYKSGELKQAITALETVQRGINAATLRALLDALVNWRNAHPNEYNKRATVTGVGYRVWKEARQTLTGIFNQAYGAFDPPRPPNCPGNTVAGIHVPEG
ncbi:MAG: hypothetical protein AAF488_17360, partial [Planctomycetota bacterium]